ncbi:MAG TPA: hypothetical protein DEG78_03150, partial [Rhodobacteraceae bacterium]|nr:hypothetical protein [Paracoccaceae bacterium]
KTRYFLFPSEVPAFPVQFARMVNVFGIAHSVQTSDAYGIQFSLSDKSESINVVFPGPLPEAFEIGSPVVVQGEFDGERFKATTILAQFSGEYFPIAALDELRSYGVLIEKN